MSHQPRVAIISLTHESNTFAPGKTYVDQFIIARGPQIIEQARNGNSAVSGFLETLGKHEIEAVPLLSASATPGAVVASETLAQFWEMIREELAGAGTLDGILVCPHGAGVSETHRDMDGWWLSQLREIVGPEMPIIGVIDPHCNLTKAMLSATNVLLPFQMNPHLDAKKRAVKAAELLVKTLSGEIRPVQKFCAPPLLINIEKQHSETPPVSDLYALCRQSEATPGILDISVLLGFPYADVPEMNSGVLVICDNNAELASQIAIDLGQKMWEMREQFLPSLLSPAEAIEKAKLSPRPVCLLDMGDNIGGGATGEGTHLLPVLAQHPDLKTFGCIYDPIAVKEAIAAGIGGAIELKIGGQTAPNRDGKPFRFVGIVKAVPPEEFFDPKMRHGGKTTFRSGACVVLQSDGGQSWILVTSKRLSPNSPEMISHCGLKAQDFDIIVAKGVNAPLGAFDEVCRSFIKVNTPGVTSADPDHFEFHHRRTPLFPFEPCCDFEATLL